MWHKLWDILAKTIGYIRINLGIYWAKTIGFLWDIFCQNLRNIFGKILGYKGQKYGIYYGIYLSKAMGYI